MLKQAYGFYKNDWRKEKEGWQGHFDGIWVGFKKLPNLGIRPRSNIKQMWIKVNLPTLEVWIVDCA